MSLRVNAAARHQHFQSIHEALALIKTDVPFNPFLGGMKDGTFVMVTDGDEMRLVPSPGCSFSSPFLYRGQVKRYSPCVPGVFRGLPPVDHPQKLSQRDRAKCFLPRVRLAEFLNLLTHHPAYDFSRELKLVISAEALAQHYELPTGRIDLTDDPEVAAFFATNWRDQSGVWQPVSEGEGVIYRIDRGVLRQLLGDNWQRSLEWVGKQVWPRPGEQKAWTLLFPLGHDFEHLPLDILTFEQSASSSLHFNEKFEGGKKLFPPDVLSEVATAIATSPTVARSLFSKELVKMGCTGSMHDRELEASVSYYAHHFGVEIVEREPMLFSPEQLAIARDQLARMKETFMDDVRLWAVRKAAPPAKPARQVVR